MCYTINMLLLGSDGDGETRSLDVSQHIGIDGIVVACTDMPNKDMVRVKEECHSLFDVCDVIAVVVDTPCLMDAFKSVSDQVNGVEEILNRLQDVVGEGKMVIFVPVKCEKWMKERRMKEVLDKLVSVYHSSLKSLCASRWTECCIIPTESIEDALQHCGQLLWHTIGYVAKKEAAVTKAQRRLGVRYCMPTISERIVKRMEELEREGVVINNGGYIRIDNRYEIPVIMENFDEMYRELPDVTK